MQKLMTSGQVCRETGLTRKLLAEYSRDGIVPATKHANICVMGCEGYKLYDEAAVNKLRQIGIFRELRVPQKEIRKIMSAPDYDSNQVLSGQIELLQKKRDEINRLLEGAEQLRWLGTKNSVLACLQGMSLKEFAAKCSRFDNSKYSKAYDSMVEEIIQQFPDSDEKMEKSFEEYFSLRVEGTSKERTDAIVKEFVDSIVEHLGVFGYLMILTIVLSAKGGGELALSFFHELDTEISIQRAEAVICYLLRCADALSDDIDSIALKHRSSIGKSFPYPEMEEISNELDVLGEKYFGFSKPIEYLIAFDMLELKAYHKGDPAVIYLLNVLKYHCEQIEATGKTAC